MTNLPDIEQAWRWTRNLRWDSHQKATKLITAKTYQCRSSWKRVCSLSWPLCTNMGSSQSWFSDITQVPFLRKENPMENYVSLWISKINTLNAGNYTSNYDLVSTLSDAAQHLAGISLFRKLHCSQAYNILQVAEQPSVEMLAIEFASKTFAYRIFAQSLSRSVSAFSSFMREYLDPVVKAGQCAQYVDDIGIVANNATDLTRNIRAVFKCIRNAGLKLTIEKCHFGVRQVEFLGRTISSEGVSPQTHKIQKFLRKLRFPKSRKDSAALFAVCEILQKKHY